MGRGRGTVAESSNSKRGFGVGAGSWVRFPVGQEFDLGFFLLQIESNSCADSQKYIDMHFQSCVLDKDPISIIRKSRPLRPVEWKHVHLHASVARGVRCRHGQVLCNMLHVQGHERGSWFMLAAPKRV